MHLCVYNKVTNPPPRFPFLFDRLLTASEAGSTTLVFDFPTGIFTLLLRQPKKGELLFGLSVFIADSHRSGAPLEKGVLQDRIGK